MVTLLYSTPQWCRPVLTSGINVLTNLHQQLNHLLQPRYGGVMEGPVAELVPLVVRSGESNYVGNYSTYFIDILGVFLYVLQVGVVDGIKPPRAAVGALY